MEAIIYTLIALSPIVLGIVLDAISDWRKKKESARYAPTK